MAIEMSDKFELDDFIDSICKKTVRRVLIQNGIIKPMMTLADCYRMLSRRKVDSAIQTGKLKCEKKGKNILVKRDDFEKYLNKHDFEV